jgi:Spx/MgsR family transcriptional regulator
VWNRLGRTIDSDIENHFQLESEGVVAKSVKVYGYKGCTTCKKAYAYLKKQDVAFDEIDITATAPTKAELKAMLAAVDGNIKKLFNTSGQVYREQKISDKLPAMSEAAALTMLAGNGRLVKRPFLIVGGKAVAVGFDEKAWAKLI